MSRIDDEAAYVLHRRAWRDSSLTVELLTERFGRLGAVARGARAPRSPLFGLVEPFRALRVGFSRRGEMATLTAIEPEAADAGLTGRALWCGLYANELLLRLTPRDDPEPTLFGAYGDLLPALREPAAQAAGLRRFELRLLEALGVAPLLTECVDSGDPVLPDRCYRVDPVAGPGPLAGGQRGFSGRLLLALAAGEPAPPGEDGDALRLMRQLIDHQLGGRKLQTPALFRENRE